MASLGCQSRAAGPHILEEGRVESVEEKSAPAHRDAQAQHRNLPRFQQRELAKLARWFCWPQNKTQR